MDVGVIGVVMVAFIFSGLIWGFFRGWKNSLIRFFEVVACAFISYFVAGSLANAVLQADLSAFNLEIAGTSISNVEGAFTAVINSIDIVKELMEASPTLNSIFTILPVILVSLILFIVMFFATKFLVWIIHAIVGSIIRKKKKKENAYNDEDSKKKLTGRLIGAGIGIIQGIICFAVVMLPIAGTTYFLADEVAYVKEYEAGTLSEDSAVASVYASEENSSGDKNVKTLDEASETLSSINKKFRVLSLFGYKPISTKAVEGLTSFELNGVETSLTAEIDNFVKIYVRAEDLIEKPLEKWTENEIKQANEAIDLFFASPITGDITSELVHTVADKWTSEDVSEQSFIGLAKPDIKGEGKEVFDVFLKQVKADTKDDLKGEFQSVVAVLDVLVKNDVINVVKTSTTAEDAIVPLSKDGVAEDVIGAMVGGRAVKNTLPTLVQFGFNQMYPMLGVSEETSKNLKITKAASDVNWDTEKVYLGNAFSGLARTYLSIQKEGEILDKLDYTSLALALENIRASELLNSRLDNGNTLGKEITLAILNSNDFGSLDGMDTVLNEVEADYEDVNFYSLLKTLKASVNVAQSMQQLNKGEIDELPSAEIKDLLNGLNDETTGKLVKDLTTSENLSGLGVDANTSKSIGSLITSVVDYNTEVNSGDPSGDAEKLPTSDAELDIASDSFKVLADVVQTGVEQEEKGSAEYKFFESKEEMKNFILDLQKSPYVYSVTLASSSTLGFKDDLNNTNLTDTEYGYLESLMAEEPETFKQSEMEKIFGYKLT